MMIDSLSAPVCICSHLSCKKCSDLARLLIKLFTQSRWQVRGSAEKGLHQWFPTLSPPERNEVLSRYPGYLLYSQLLELVCYANSPLPSPSLTIWVDYFEGVNYCAPGFRAAIQICRLNSEIPILLLPFCSANQTQRPPCYFPSITFM